MNWYYGGYWLFPGLIELIIWIIVISFIVRILRHRWEDHHFEKSAEEILAERFAKGEIDEAEYKKKLEILKKHAK